MSSAWEDDRWRHIYAGEIGATFHLVVTGPTTIPPAAAPTERLIADVSGPVSLPYVGSIVATVTLWPAELLPSLPRPPD